MFSAEKSLLVVRKGGLELNTKYSIKVTVTNKKYPIATTTKVLNFQTGIQPKVGVVSINPRQGYLLTTIFTMGITGFSSSYDNSTLKYKVLAITGKETLELTNGWYNQNLVFKSTLPYLSTITF